MQTYHIARATLEGPVSIREFDTYSEAEAWLDHYRDIYDYSVVDILPGSAIPTANTNDGEL